MSEFKVGQRVRLQDTSGLSGPVIVKARAMPYLVIKRVIAGVAYFDLREVGGNAEHSFFIRRLELVARNVSNRRRGCRILDK